MTESTNSRRTLPPSVGAVYDRAFFPESNKIGAVIDRAYRRRRHKDFLCKASASLLRSDGNAEQSADEICKGGGDGADSKHPGTAEEEAASSENRYQSS